MIPSAFDVLAEPARRGLLDQLLEGEKSAGELVASSLLSQPGVSKHLKVLRDAGLVSVRSDAQRRLYRLRPEALIEVDQWISQYRRFWTDRLDALQQHLEQEN